MTTDTNTQINRGDKLELTLSAWGRLGEALAYWNDREVFVSGGIPGEEVVAEIVAIRRKYIAAKVVQVTKASPQELMRLVNIMVLVADVSGSMYLTKLSCQQNKTE